MRSYQFSYKGYDVYYEYEEEYAAPPGYWVIVDKYGAETWLSGYLDYRDVMEYIDKATKTIGPHWEYHMDIRSFNSTTSTL